MSAKMTVVEMLETLQGQIDFHRGQEELHGQQEIHHREERERHAGELAAVTFGATAFCAAASRRSSSLNLRGDSDARAASLFLRRRLQEGLLESVREGRAYHEALYRKPG